LNANIADLFKKLDAEIFVVFADLNEARIKCQKIGVAQLVIDLKVGNNQNILIISHFFIDHVSPRF
jgi:hypothetical protein